MSSASRLRKPGSRGLAAGVQAGRSGSWRPWSPGTRGGEPVGPPDAGLYREGRQAEALRSYQRVREILLDELGIDLPELVRLHQRVLQQDPGLDLRGEPLRGYRLLEKIDAGPTGLVFRRSSPASNATWPSRSSTKPSPPTRSSSGASNGMLWPSPPWSIRTSSPSTTTGGSPAAPTSSLATCAGEPPSHRGEGSRWSESGSFVSSSRSLWASRSRTARGSRTGTSCRPTSSSTPRGTPISGTSDRRRPGA